MGRCVRELDDVDALKCCLSKSMLGSSLAFESRNVDGQDPGELLVAFSSTIL